MEVSFKPAGCLLKFRTTILQCGFASVLLEPDSYMRGCRCSMIMGFTKPIEHFNLTTKEGDFMNPLYVGIDVSSKSNAVYLMLPNGDKHSSFELKNSHDGSTQLVKRILSALTSESLDTVLIGLEATSVYGDNPVYFLREDASLAPYNRKIHVLNPKQVSSKNLIMTCLKMITWTHL